MSPDILNVQMFGDFELRCGDKKIALERSHATRAMHLLQYFLYFPGSHFTREQLIQILYANDDILDPANNFKVNLFRLRKLLGDSGIFKGDLLLFQNGTYFINPEIVIEVDAHKFEHLWLRASDPTLTPSEHLTLLKEAFFLYQGEFLPLLTSEEWVMVENTRYKKMYLDCLVAVSDLLTAQENYAALLPICDQCITIYPYEEAPYLIKIFGLIKLHDTKEALNLYNNMTSSFFMELGISPTEEMQQLYRKICEAAENNNSSVFAIKDNLQEENETNGAYYCNYVSFMDSYQIIMRIMERAGQSAFLMLCTLTDQKRDKNNPAFANKYKTYTEKLQVSIQRAIRRGDIFTRYSANQFILLLIGTNQENCTLISHRIDKTFRSLCHSKEVSVHYNIVAANHISSPEKTFPKES